MSQIDDKASALIASGYPLGSPLEAEQSGPSGGRYRRYSGPFGTTIIYWKASAGAHEVHGDILQLYLSLGGPASPLGYPLTDELGTTDGWGRYNDFEHNSIYWDSRHGTPAYVIKPAPAACVSPGASHGQWTTPAFTSGVVGVHAALLRGNKVLFMSYKEPPPGTPPGPQRNGSSAILDVSSGYLSTPAYLDLTGNPISEMENLFCSAHAFLSDGRLLIAGGERDVAGIRSESVRAIHVAERVGGIFRIRHVADCAHGRWYPQCSTLPDGRVLMIGGDRLVTYGTTRNVTFEIYDPADDSVTAEATASFEAGYSTYPFVLVLPSRKVFVHIGTTTSFLSLDTMTFDAATLPAAARSDRASRTYGLEGTCVLLPLSPTSTPPYRAKVMMIGGGGTGERNAPATASCEVLDLGAANPQWTLVAPMANRRVMPDSVLLPDGTVFVTNGSRTGGADNGADPVYEGEIYHPATNTWTTVCHMTTARLYHATAILLPDARVLVAGTDSAWNLVPYNTAQLKIEIFSPPYLFNGARPVITSSPSTITYDDDFNVHVDDGAQAAKGVLVRCGSTTHSFNPDQRLVELVMEARTGTTLTFRAPPDSAIAPPGYYLLFVLNASGVPSVARYVRLFAGPGKLLEKHHFEKAPAEKLRKEHPEKPFVEFDPKWREKLSEGPQEIPRPEWTELQTKVRDLTSEVQQLRAFIQQRERPEHLHTAHVVGKWPATTSAVLPGEGHGIHESPATDHDHTSDQPIADAHSHSHADAHSHSHADAHSHSHAEGAHTHQGQSTHEDDLKSR